MKIKSLNTQYSLITITKECPICKGWGRIFLDNYQVIKREAKICPDCKKGKITQNHIVPNNGWLPLQYWINKFTKFFDNG